MTYSENFTVCTYNVGGLIHRKEKTDYLYANILHFSDFDKLFSDKSLLYHGYSDSVKTAGLTIVVNKKLYSSIVSSILN